MVLHADGAVLIHDDAAHDARMRRDYGLDGMGQPAQIYFVIEVGFSIERASWGKGYASEALEAVLDYLTAQEDIACVTAWCASDNIASKRTLEKAGMRLAAIDTGGLEIVGQSYDKLDYTYSDQESE